MQKATGKKVHQNYKELLSPGVVAILVGLILFLTNQFGSIPLKEVLTDKDGYILSAGKLIADPAICLVLARLVFPDMSVFVKKIIPMATMPAAACSVIFAKKYEADVEYATKGVVLSTLLSLITIPVFAILVEM